MAARHFSHDRQAAVDGAPCHTPVAAILRSVEVLTRAELVAHLGSRWALDRSLGVTWQRVLHGAYVPAGLTLDLRLRAQAAQRLLPVDAYVADRCLLWLLGIPVLPLGPPLLEVVVPRGAVVPRRPGLHAREALLPASDREQVSGVRCVRPVRAVADLLRLLPAVDAVVVADAVLHAELATPRDLEDELAAHARLRGVRAARVALARSDGRAESPPETRVRLLLTGAGLAPVPQYDVHNAAGRWIARVDLALPRLRLAIEYDGQLVHELPGAFTRDRARQNDLVLAGWTVLRLTAADLRRHGHVAQLVLDAISRLTAAA